MRHIALKLVLSTCQNKIPERRSSNLSKGEGIGKGVYNFAKTAYNSGSMGQIDSKQVLKDREGLPLSVIMYVYQNTKWHQIQKIVKI